MDRFSFVYRSVSQCLYWSWIVEDGTRIRPARGVRATRRETRRQLGHELYLASLFLIIILFVSHLPYGIVFIFLGSLLPLHVNGKIMPCTLLNRYFLSVSV